MILVSFDYVSFSGVYACTCVRVGVCTHVRVCACTCVRAYACTRVRVYVCTCVRMYACARLHAHVCTRVRVELAFQSVRRHENVPPLMITAIKIRTACARGSIWGPPGQVRATL